MGTNMSLPPTKEGFSLDSIRFSHPDMLWSSGLLSSSSSAEVEVIKSSVDPGRPFEVVRWFASPAAVAVAVAVVVTGAAPSTVVAPGSGAAVAAAETGATEVGGSVAAAAEVVAVVSAPPCAWVSSDAVPPPRKGGMGESAPSKALLLL